MFEEMLDKLIKLYIWLLSYVTFNVYNMKKFNYSCGTEVVLEKL